MSNYKRLTEVKNGIVYSVKKTKSNYIAAICEEQKKIDYEIYTRLAKLEDKIENGTLIELPCKVGDKFYQVVKGLPIYEWEVETIAFSNIYFPKNYVITARRIKDLARWKFWCEDFGEILFLTKAEAEEKLKEQQNER